MYEQVRAYHRPRWGNGPLVAGLLVCAVIFALILGLIGFAGWYQLRFRAFVGNLSDSTTYAYQHDCLRAELDGQSVQVSGDELYQIYAVISNAGPGRLGWAPEEAPAALLDYGDGSYMQLWSVKLDNSSTSREYGLFLRYVDQEGRAYAYATDQLSLGEVTVYLAPSRD